MNVIIFTTKINIVISPKIRKTDGGFGLSIDYICSACVLGKISEILQLYDATMLQEGKFDNSFQIYHMMKWRMLRHFKKETF